MQQSGQLRYRYFFLSFSMGFFLLSVLFLFLVITVHPSTPSSLEAALPAEGTAVYIPTEEDALTVLFIGTETGASSAESFLLARFDPARGRIPLVMLPAQTAVRNGDRWESLADVYRYGGAEYTRAALSNTLGVPIDRYVRMTADAFIASAATVGTVEFDLPYDLTLEQGGMHLVLTQGRQLLDGTKVCRILGYRGYEGGDLTRCRLGGEVAAAIINQRIDVVESTLIDQIFRRIINLIDTDITYADYDNRRDAAIFLIRLEDLPAYPLQVVGGFNPEETLYTLSDTFLAQLGQSFL